MSEELAKLRKENKAKSARIENLTKELGKVREEKGGLAKELEQVTEHRDRLLDKVERLHADKHTLEARYVHMNTMMGHWWKQQKKYAFYMSAYIHLHTNAGSSIKLKLPLI